MEGNEGKVISPHPSRSVCLVKRAHQLLPDLAFIGSFAAVYVTKPFFRYFDHTSSDLWQASAGRVLLPQMCRGAVPIVFLRSASLDASRSRGDIELRQELQNIAPPQQDLSPSS